MQALYKLIKKSFVIYGQILKINIRPIFPDIWIETLTQEELDNPWEPLDTSNSLPQSLIGSGRMSFL